MWSTRASRVVFGALAKDMRLSPLDVVLDQGDEKKHARAPLLAKTLLPRSIFQTQFDGSRAGPTNCSNVSSCNPSRAFWCISKNVSCSGQCGP